MGKRRQSLIEFAQHLSTRKVIARLYQNYIRRHRGDILVALVFMSIVAATTALFAAGIAPILDKVFLAKDKAILRVIALGVFTIFILRGLASYGQNVIMNRIGQRIISDLQFEMFNKLIYADLSFFHSNPTGSLMTRFTNDVSLLRLSVSTAITSVGKDMLTILFMIGVLFYQDWFLASLVFVAFPTVVMPVIKLSRRLKKIALSSQEQTSTLSGLLEQAFQGIRYVKAYTMEPYEIQKAQTVIEHLYKTILKAVRARALASPIMEIFGGVTIILVIIYGGTQVIDGNRTAGTFISFIVALFLTYDPMRRLSQLNAELQEGFAAAIRIFEILDHQDYILEEENAKHLAVSNGHIHFKNASFTYADNTPALYGINLTIEGGKTTAVVGPSGAGKSTILNLIPRFFDVTKGSITIDNQRVDRVTVKSLRENIGLVSQEIALFDDTIRTNIAYGKPNATDDEIIQAAKNAAAHDFIMKLPQKYNTRVGEFGVKLSGGQRQRISIARAILKNAPILLLDEATSALDSKSESIVHKALENLMKGKTTLIVAHRLSTIMNADVIYVMNQGQIVEEGSHKELLKKKGFYAELYALQGKDLE